jgi:hypothetical protein
LRIYTLGFAALLIFSFLTGAPAEARRHKKFKGVIIVNQILKLTGKLTRNGEDAPEYSGVKQGDVLETGDKSEAVIRIPGLLILQMKPNTKMKLTQFGNRDNSRFEILTGGVLFVFKRNGDHTLKLNRSTITIHQPTTFFVVSAQESKFDQLCLCDGKVGVEVREPLKKKSNIIIAETQAPPPNPKAPAILKAENTPTLDSTPKSSPTPSPTPTATATPEPTPASTMEVTSNNENKQWEISEDGIVSKPEGKLLELHNQDQIKELESLYALP